MKNRYALLLLLLTAVPALGQLSVSNLAEYQHGNLPFTDPSNLSTLYDQLNVSYRYRNFAGFAKFEQFQTGEPGADYVKFTQRSLRYRSAHFELSAGNLYEIIGRGLLLRSYEIPGTILEDVVFRTRYGFYRDLDGFSFKYRNRFVELNVLRGKPLNNSLPPTFGKEKRRHHLVQGGELSLNLPQGWILGGSLLHDKSDNQARKYGGISISGNLPLNFQIYSEFAQRIGKGNPAFNLSDNTSHALYFSANTYLGPVGFSGEYKDYNNFYLEFNDPPPLIKEHPYVLLNRSTHILNTINETGWQLEMFYTMPQGHGVTLNFTRAKNNFGEADYLFKEFYLELQYQPDPGSTIKAFYDRSQDPFQLEKNRNAGGMYLEKGWFKRWGTTLDLEYQSLQRGFLTFQDVKNYAAILEISRAPGLSAGVIWERTTDPLLTDNPATLQEEKQTRNWLGFTLAWQLTAKQNASLFYGKRRGGPACTSGICYEVLDFEGLEFRLTSLF